jgi:hypothetical protein
MKSSLHITGAIMAALALGGCAATTRTAQGPAPKQLASADPSCLHETGSALPPSNTGCSGFGRSYSSEDISRTGKTNAGPALQLLDPSITTH